MSHFIRKCECGAVIMQCRCISTDKKVEIVRPCTHTFVTHSVASTEPITMESLVEAKLKFESESRYIPNTLKCHPSTYAALRMYFYKKEEEERQQGVRPLPLENLFTQSILGVQIYIDDTLEPGEWKFEDVHKKGESDEEYKFHQGEDLSGNIFVGAKRVKKESRG